MSEKALNRVADALFQLAKEHRKQNAIQAEALEISKRICSVQEQQARVSAALESQLMLDRHEYTGSSN